jgi:UDP-glucose 4-epimerase
MSRVFSQHRTAPTSPIRSNVGKGNTTMVNDVSEYIRKHKQVELEKSTERRRQVNSVAKTRPPFKI